MARFAGAAAEAKAKSLQGAADNGVFGPHAFAR